MSRPLCHQSKEEEWKEVGHVGYSDVKSSKDVVYDVPNRQMKSWKLKNSRRKRCRRKSIDDGQEWEREIERIHRKVSGTRQISGRTLDLLPEIITGF